LIQKLQVIEIDRLPTHVRLIQYKQARRIIEQNHYLCYAPCGCKFCLGIYADSDFVGVMIWGHPIARMEEQVNTLELTRMFLFDSPKNSESRALSLAEKWIKTNRTERRLIAYSDTAEGHLGIVYRAANWKLIKEVRAETWIRKGRDRKGMIGGKKLKFERCIKTPIVRSHHAPLAKATKEA
jgi:hypothetical protein